MTKIDIVSGFLGAGKTTLIKKLLAEAYKGEKLVLIENEFGEINIDGGFLKESGIQISEMSAGCICCSLVGDFNKALKDVEAQFHPDRILIEPSGVGKLSDVIVAVENTVKDVPEMKLNSFVTVADATKVKVYMKNFGEFYNNQIEHASAIILSRTQNLPEDKLAAAVALLRGHNEKAPIVTTPWDALTGAQLLDAMEQKNSLMAELTALAGETAHTHHHHEDGCTCEACRHEHGHDEHRHDHGDEHCHDEAHAHGGNCCHSAEEHHHGEDCTCGTCRDGHGHNHAEHHHHSHEGHHHADEVFTSWGTETPRKYTDDEIRTALDALINEHRYGVVLRAKGIVPATDGGWIHFDYVPGESDVRRGSAQVTGRVCVIGSHLAEDALKELFHIG